VSISTKRNCLELREENNVFTVLFLTEIPARREKSDLFLAFAKARIVFLLFFSNFFFFSVAVKWAKKVSSHQPYERKDPVHPIKLQYLCIPLHVWRAEVAVVLAEPAKVVHSRS